MELDKQALDRWITREDGDAETDAIIDALADADYDSPAEYD
jgi:hypothetical protein